MISDDFKARAKYYAPAPPEETPEYKIFNNNISMYSISFMILMSYFFSIFLNEYVDYVYFKYLKFFDFLDGRIYLLKSYDSKSYHAFISVLTVAIVSSPVIFAIWIAGYWKTVVMPRRCRPFVVETFLVMIFTACTVASVSFIALVFVPDSSNLGHSRWAVFLVWPFSPLFDAFILWLSIASVVSIVIGVFKFLFLRRGHIAGRPMNITDGTP